MTAQTLASSPDNASPLHSGSWQRDLASAFRRAADLLQFLGLDPALCSEQAATDFNCLVTQHYAEQIKPGDVNDPLLRQVLPIADENQVVAGFGVDPVGESQAHCAPGLLQKYRSRALLVSTGACAIHCRYCFRRHFDYQQTAYQGQWWRAAWEHIQADPEIDELILSGGDPLILSNRQLGEIIEAFAMIPHLRRIRFHSRIPIVLPSRIDEELLRIFSAAGVPIVMVVHANHANEISDSVRTALQALQKTQVRLLNQSVLLRGVNDDVQVIKQLSHALFDAAVMPYYMHVLDPVAGAAHFLVPDDEAQALMRDVQKNLAGYMVPRLVREEPGAASKTLIPF